MREKPSPWSWHWVTVWSSIDISVKPLSCAAWHAKSDVQQSFFWVGWVVTWTIKSVSFPKMKGSDCFFKPLATPTKSNKNHKSATTFNFKVNDNGIIQWYVKRSPQLLLPAFLVLKLPTLNPKSSHGPSVTVFDDGFCNHSKDASVIATLIAASPVRVAFDFVLSTNSKSNLCWSKTSLKNKNQSRHVCLTSNSSKFIVWCGSTLRFGFNGASDGGLNTGRHNVRAAGPMGFRLKSGKCRFNVLITTTICVLFIKL